MKNYFCLLFLLLFFLACTPFKMSVSDSLKTSGEEYSVKGRNGILLREKLSFGDYKTTRVKRSWTRTLTPTSGIGNANTKGDFLGLISAEYIDKKQSLHFSLTDGSNTSEVFCAAKFDAMDINAGNNPNTIFNIGLDLAGLGGSSNSTYYVQIYLNNNGTPWELLLDNQSSQRDAKSYKGYLVKGKDQVYTLYPVTKLEKEGKAGNILLGSVGFEIKNKNGESVAAVNTMDKGVVYLKKLKDEERFLMANLCTAILLQQQID